MSRSVVFWFVVLGLLVGLLTEVQMSRADEDRVIQQVRQCQQTGSCPGMGGE